MSAEQWALKIKLPSWIEKHRRARGKGNHTKGVLKRLERLKRKRDEAAKEVKSPPGRVGPRDGGEMSW